MLDQWTHTFSMDMGPFGALSSPAWFLNVLKKVQVHKNASYSNKSKYISLLPPVLVTSGGQHT